VSPANAAGTVNPRRPAIDEFLMKADNTASGVRIPRRTLILIAILCGLLGLTHFSGLGNYLDPRHLPFLREQLVGLPPLAAKTLFVAGGALLILAGVGRNAVSLAGGIIYGAGWGAVYSVLAALLGSLPVFGLVRALGRPFFPGRIGAYLESADRLVTRNGFLAVILIRQLPLACLLVNVLIAVTRVRTAQFIAGSLVGFLPEALVFALYGSSAQEGFCTRAAIASILLLAIAVGAKLLHKKLTADFKARS